MNMHNVFVVHAHLRRLKSQMATWGKKKSQTSTTEADCKVSLNESRVNGKNALMENKK